MAFGHLVAPALITLACFCCLALVIYYRPGDYFLSYHMDKLITNKAAKQLIDKKTAHYQALAEQKAAADAAEMQQFVTAAFHQVASAANKPMSSGLIAAEWSSGDGAYTAAPTGSSPWSMITTDQATSPWHHPGHVPTGAGGLGQIWPGTSLQLPSASLTPTIRTASFFRASPFAVLIVVGLQTDESWDQLVKWASLLPISIFLQSRGGADQMQVLPFRLTDGAVPEELLAKDLKGLVDTL